MQVLSCANQKGGVGKTTTAINLSGALVELGHTVVVLDLDEQQSAVRWAPEGIRVEALTRALESARVLKDRLEALEREGVSYVVLDAPPAVGPATLGSALLSTAVLVPVAPSGLDLHGATVALEIVRDARAVLKTKTPLCIFVPNRIQGGTLLARQLENALEKYGEIIAPAIVQRVSIAEASLSGQWVGAYAAASPAREEYLALARFVQSTIAQKRKSTTARESK